MSTKQSKPTESSQSKTTSDKSKDSEQKQSQTAQQTPPSQPDSGEPQNQEPTAGDLNPPKLPLDVTVPNYTEPTNEVNNESVLISTDAKVSLPDLSADELKKLYDQKRESEQQEADRRLQRPDVSNEPVSGTAPKREAGAAPTKKNFTKEDLDELKYKQSVDPESIATASGNQDSEYKFPKHEENLVHVELEERVFDPTTGQKLSKPKVQKYWPQEYADTVARGGLVGYTATIKHKPAALDEIEKRRAEKRKA